MTTVNIEDVEGHLRDYFERAQQGEVFVVVDSGKTVGQLLSIDNAPKEPRPRGLYKGQFTVPDDFDDPLPDDILAAFKGRD